MKVLINTRKFREYVSQCSTALSSRRLIPILQSFLLNAKDRPYISAFDGRVGMQIYIDDCVTVESSGICLLPGEKLLQILRLEDSESLLIELTSSDRITINGNVSEYRVAFLDYAEYPNVSFDVMDAIELNTTELRKCIKLMSPFICKDNSRPFMQGILLEMVEDDWFLVAGDGKRMANIKLKNGGVVKNALPSWLLCSETNTYRFLIPSDFLPCVMQMNNDPILNIGFTQETGGANQIVFKCGNTESKGIAVEGDFPDWRQPFNILGNQMDSSFTVNRKDFDVALQKAGIGTDVLDKIDKKVYLSCNSDGFIINNKDETFDYSEVLPYVEESRNGDMPLCCANPDFLRYVTSNLSTDTVKIVYTNKNKDTMFLDSPEENLRALIMLKRI